MLTDNDKLAGRPIRAEIRVPRGEGAAEGWFSSVVVCQDVDKGTFIVWSVYQRGAFVHAENGIYDIPDYAKALRYANARAGGAV